nr:hypothetical protein [Melittangium boletus]
MFGIAVNSEIVPFSRPQMIGDEAQDDVLELSFLKSKRRIQRTSINRIPDLIDFEGRIGGYTAIEGDSNTTDFERRRSLIAHRDRSVATSFPLPLISKIKPIRQHLEDSLFKLKRELEMGEAVITGRGLENELISPIRLP